MTARPATIAPMPLADLVALTSSVADDVRAGLYEVHADEQNRWHVRLLCDDQVDVWLISWTQEQGTQLHDHGWSSGAFTVVSGTLTEAVWTPGVDVLAEVERGDGRLGRLRRALRARRAQRSRRDRRQRARVLTAAAPDELLPGRGPPAHAIWHRCGPTTRRRRHPSCGSRRDRQIRLGGRAAGLSTSRPVPADARGGARPHGCRCADRRHPSGLATGDRGGDPRFCHRRAQSSGVASPSGVGSESAPGRGGAGVDRGLHRGLHLVAGGGCSGVAGPAGQRHRRRHPRVARTPGCRWFRDRPRSSSRWRQRLEFSPARIAAGPRSRNTV